ncbi:MAG: elongation factor P [Chloroflexi bacterium]|nr:elongation factor P [Chloroflexota bacterium]
MDISDVRKSTKLMIDNVPYDVEEAEFMKPGKGSAIYRFKLRNLVDGSSINRTYHSGEKFTPASVSTEDGQFLYRDGSNFIFMSTENYEQYTIDESLLGDKSHFLKEGTIVTITMLEDRPLDVILPNFVELKVLKSDVSTKTETFVAQMKSATLETGHEIDVPTFIKEGDVIKIDTRTGTYVERATAKK